MKATISKAERERINAEFSRLYPAWPAALKLTAAGKQKLISTWHQDMARSAEILAS